VALARIFQCFPPRWFLATTPDESWQVIYGEGGAAVAQQVADTLRYFVRDRLGSR
jgi:hypothetical protein